MAFDRARTSLQSVEEKLRRLFGLAGTIGAAFSPEITGSVDVGSLDDPGLAAYRGRHWAWVSGLNVPLVNGVVGIQFGAECIVRGIGACSNYGAAMNPTAAYFFPPELNASAPAVALATITGTWIDQRTRTTDNPPLFSTNAAATALAGAIANFTTAQRIASLGNSNGFQRVEWFRGLHAPAGSAIYFDVNALTAGNNVVFSAWGQIF